MEEIKLVDIEHETKMLVETDSAMDIEMENSLGHCANCYQPLQNNQNNINSDTKFWNQNPLQIPESLSSLYKLNYLPAFLDEEEESIWMGCIENEDENESVKLCDNCLHVFLNLYKLYEDFNHLRSMESCLAKQIQKLDDCVKAHQVIRKINADNCEFKPKFEKGYKKRIRPSRSKKNSTTSKTALTSKNKKRDKISTLKSGLGSGPWVVIKRLENDPVAQTALRSSKRIQEKAKLFRNSNTKPNVKLNMKQERDSSANEDDGDDRDFCVEKEESDEDEENESCGDAEYEDGEIPPSKKKNGTKSPKIYKSHRKGSKVPKRYLMTRKVYAQYRHRKTKVPNPCWISTCPMDFPTPTELYNHTMSQHYKKGMFVCEVCSRINDTKASHAMHARKCASLKPGEILSTYNCEFCEKAGVEKAFAIKSELQSHLAIVHQTERDAYACTIEGCSFVAKNQYYWKSHIERHQKRKQKPVPITTCQECGKTFKTRNILKAHMFHFHTEEGMQKKKTWLEEQKEKRRQKAEQTSTVCAECNVDFYSLMCLLHHRKEFHGSDFPFVCDQCGRRFSKKANLKYHINNAHSNSRNWICDSCGRTYKSSRHLKEHRKTHSEDGRTTLNQQIRERNRRKRLIKQALAQSLGQQQNQSPSSTTNIIPTSVVQPEQLTTVTTCQLVNQNLNINNSNNTTTTIEYEMPMTSTIINNNVANVPPEHFVIATSSSNGTLGFNSNLAIGLTFQQF